MCKSRAEGGQRCYSHARKAMDAALAERERIAPMVLLHHQGTPGDLPWSAVQAVEGRVLRTQLDLASTPQGRAEFEAQKDQAAGRGDNEEVARLAQLIERGEFLAERNASMQNIYRNDRFQGPKKRVAVGKMDLTPQQIRAQLAQPLPPGQAKGAVADLGHTLLKFKRSAQHKQMVGQRKNDETNKMLHGTPEGHAEEQRLHHQWAALNHARTRWERITETPNIDASTAWSTFVSETRQARDNVPTNVAFADHYQRDSNFVLRLCAEIAHNQQR